MTQDQLETLTDLFSNPPTTQAYMLQELHIEPQRTASEPTLYRFFKVLGGSAFCDFVVHLSLGTLYDQMFESSVANLHITLR